MSTNTKHSKIEIFLISMIIDVFSKENIIIGENNIKICDGDKMSISSVVDGCNYIKMLEYMKPNFFTNKNNPILVYTTIVPNKDYLEKNEYVKIYDIVDLEKLSLKHKNYKLYDLLNC